MVTRRKEVSLGTSGMHGEDINSWHAIANSFLFWLSEAKRKQLSTNDEAMSSRIAQYSIYLQNFTHVGVRMSRSLVAFAAPPLSIPNDLPPSWIKRSHGGIPIDLERLPM